MVGLFGPGRDQVCDGGTARLGHEGDLGPLIVRDQEFLGPGKSLLDVFTQCARQLVDHPAWMTVHHGQVTDRVVFGGRRDDLCPGLQVTGTDLAQDGVDEPGTVVSHGLAGQIDRCADRRVRRDLGGQQLVRAQAEQRKHLGVHGGQRAVHAGLQDRVIGTSVTQCAVGQLRGQGGVPAADAALVEQGGQQQVRVGVPLVDGEQHVVGDLACGVAGAGRPGPSITARLGFSAPPRARVWGPGLLAQRVFCLNKPGMCTCGCRTRQSREYGSSTAQPVVFGGVYTTSPVRGRHGLLALRLDLAEFDRVGAGSHQHVLFVGVQLAGGQFGTVGVGDRADRAELHARFAEGRPGTGGRCAGPATRSTR